MKDKVYTDIICKKFCKHYKEGKEGLACGGYVFLTNNITPHELKSIITMGELKKNLNNRIPSGNKEMLTLVCKKCEFFIGGCDYAENRSGPPCGGYILIERLLC